MNQAIRQILVNAEISRRIVAKMAEGLELPKAFDAVIGEGAYMKLAHDVYTELRARV